MPFDLAALRFWAAPELTALGRLPMRSPLVSHPTTAAARVGDRDASPWFRRLDGRWRFRLLADPSQIPVDVGDATFDDGTWTTVDVPGLWTMQDSGDLPQYTNVQMPFVGAPPEVPANDNPTGCYRTTFDVPGDWADRRVVLHLGAAESVVAVLVNGHFVGISKDSHLAAEFDVTDVVVPGAGNLLACVVVKWSDASYLEDQDQWWHGGLSREVFLRSTSEVHVADVKAIAGLTDDLTAGTIQLRVEVAAGGGHHTVPDGWMVRGWLETLDGDPVRGTHELGGAVPSASRPFGFTGHVVRSDVTVDGVTPWSAEAPNLYRLIVELLDPAGVTSEVVSQRIGFRRVEIGGRELRINGAPVLIRGVNRHDFHPETGRVVSELDLRRDVVAMKRFGFNAVRTSHYPNDPRLLDLCDELGLYVIDEADIETHATMFTLCHDPRYTAAFVDRGARMVQRDKNHACIVAWSLGNESGHGTNQEAMAAWIRRYDPSRPLHYEGAVMFGLERGSSVTDIVCPMYPPIERIVAWATSGEERPDDQRPLIMCEYSHAMGNSNGCLAEYWDAIESHHGLQGGFIWEWWDHGLRQSVDDGRDGWRYAYGGDFGEERHDGNFCLDGVVWPDGRPKPALWEHRQLATPLRLAWAGRSTSAVVVANRQYFRSSSWLRVTCDVLVDGGVARTHEVPIPEVDPQSEGTIDLAFDMPADADSLVFHVLVRDDEAWAPAAFELAFQQLDLRTATSDPIAPTTPFAGWPVGVASGPTLSLWRAPVDNDRVRAGLPADSTPAHLWHQWGVDILDVVTEEEGEGSASIVRTYAGNIVHRQERSTTADGGVVISEEVIVPDGFHDLARVGTVLTIDAGLEVLEWYGRGPVETYPDRKLGSPVQRWSSTVAGEYVPYIRPQEHGGHEDVRWLRLLDHDGMGLELRFDDPLHVSAGHFTASDLAEASHDNELVARAETFVHVDAAHRGLGTASCGPDTLEHYLVGPGTYRWRWAITPITHRSSAGVVRLRV